MIRLGDGESLEKIIRIASRYLPALGAWSAAKWIGFIDYKVSGRVSGSGHIFSNLNTVPVDGSCDGDWSSGRNGYSCESGHMN